MKTSPFVVRCEGIALPGGFVVPDHARALVVFLHGIPSGRPPEPGENDPGYPGLARTFAERGFATAWFDMRGVREAGGSFSPAGWERDVHAILGELRAMDVLGGLDVILVGASGSGPTALRVAATRGDIAGVATFAAVGNWMEPDFLPDPETLVLHFRSIGLIREPAFPPDTAAWFAEFAEDARGVVASIAPRPVLIVHGEADPVVPYHHAELLYAAAAEPKQLVRIPGGGHQLRRDPRALDALATWIDTTVLAVRR